MEDKQSLFDLLLLLTVLLAGVLVGLMLHQTILTQLKEMGCSTPLR